MATAIGNTKHCPKCTENKPLDAFGRLKSSKDGLNPNCKPCVAAHRMKWVEANREQARKNHRAWVNSHKAEQKVYRAEWWQRHSERLAAEALERRRVNGDFLRERERLWYAANREKILERKREWARVNRPRLRVKLRAFYKANADKVKAWIRTRRARKHGAAGKYTPEDISRILRSQKHRCAYCRADIRKRPSIDHIVPLTKGGSNHPKNLQMTCVSCNSSKNAQDPIKYAQKIGLLL